MGRKHIALAILTTLLLLTIQFAQGSCLIQKLPTYLKVSEDYDADMGQLVVHASLSYVDPATGKNEPLVGQPLKFTLNYTDSKGEHTEELSVSTNAAGKAQATFAIPGSKLYKVKVRYEGTTGFKESEGEASGGWPEMASAVQTQLPEGINLITCMPLLLLVGLLGAAMYASGHNPFGMVDFTAPQGIRTQRRLMKQTVGGWMAAGTSMAAFVGNIMMIAGLSGIKARTVDEGKGKEKEGKKEKSEAAAKNMGQGQGAAKPPVTTPAGHLPKKEEKTSKAEKKEEGTKKVEITSKDATKVITAIDYESRHAIRAITAGAIIAALGGDFTKIRDFFAIHGMAGVKTVDKEGKLHTILALGTSPVARKFTGMLRKEIDELYTEGKITKDGATGYSEPQTSQNKVRASVTGKVANAKKNEVVNIKAKAVAEKKELESEKEAKEKEKRKLETQLKDKKAELEKADANKKAALEKEVKELSSKLGSVEREIKSLNGRIVAANEKIDACDKSIQDLESIIKVCEGHQKALLEMEKDSKKAAEQLKSEAYMRASKSFIEYCQVNGYLSGNEITVQEAKRIIRELRDNGKGREADELESRLRPVLEPLVMLSNITYFNERLASTLNGLASDTAMQIRLMNQLNLPTKDLIATKIGDLALKNDELRKQIPQMSRPVFEIATPTEIVNYISKSSDTMMSIFPTLIEEAVAQGDIQKANQLRNEWRALNANSDDVKIFVASSKTEIDHLSKEAIKPYWEKAIALTETAIRMGAYLANEYEKKINESCEKYGVGRTQEIIDKYNELAKDREKNAKTTDEEIKKLFPPELFTSPKEVPNPYEAPDRKALQVMLEDISQRIYNHMMNVTSTLIPNEEVKKQMKIDEEGAPLSPEEKKHYEEALKYNETVIKELIEINQKLNKISIEIQDAPNVDELVAECVKLARETASKYPMKFKNNAEIQEFENTLANAQAAAKEIAEREEFIEDIRKLMGDYRPGDSVYGKYYGKAEMGAAKYVGFQRPSTGK